MYISEKNHQSVPYAISALPGLCVPTTGAKTDLPTANQIFSEGFSCQKRKERQQQETVPETKSMVKKKKPRPHLWHDNTYQNTLLKMFLVSDKIKPIRNPSILIMKLRLQEGEWKEEEQRVEGGCGNVVHSKNLIKAQVLLKKVPLRGLSGIHKIFFLPFSID